MTTRRIISGLAVTIVLAFTSALLGPASAQSPAPAASAAGSSAPVQYEGKDVVRFDLFFQGEVKPHRIFFTANSGTYLKKLKWEDWGERKTVGRGWYISDCASCSGPPKRKAKIRMTGRTYCETEDVYFYAKALMTRKPSKGQTRTVRVDGASCPEPGDE